MTPGELGGAGILFVVGAVAGFLNVLAGGGSFLTLPVLIFLGLPPTVANGTNRVGIVMQNLGAVFAFHRHRVLDVRLGFMLSLPAIAGAVAGARLAVILDEMVFQKMLAFLMIALTLLTLWEPSRMVGAIGRNWSPGVRNVLLMVVFFFIGVYGGFIQAGIGFLVIAALVATGMDLVRTNAIKLLVILLLTFPAFAVFLFHGKVDWVAGVALGAGNLAGAQIAVRVAVRKGHAWIRGFVTVTVIVLAIKLLVEA